MFKLLQNESSEPVRFSHNGRTYKLCGVDSMGKPVPVRLRTVKKRSTTLTPKGLERVFQASAKEFVPFSAKPLPGDEIVSDNSAKVDAAIADTLVSYAPHALKLYGFESKEASPVLERLRLEQNELLLEKARIEAELSAANEEMQKSNARHAAEMEDLRKQLSAASARGAKRAAAVATGDVPKTEG
jgi:hypothetical protein